MASQFLLHNGCVLHKAVRRLTFASVYVLILQYFHVLKTKILMTFYFVSTIC